MRLIDADELIPKMQAIKEAEHQIYGYGANSWGFVARCMEAVESVPTIEPEPVRHAHWNGWTATHWTKKYNDYGDPIYKEHTYYQCSECRRRTIIKSAYCPACGCKMDEVSE